MRVEGNKSQEPLNEIVELLRNLLIVQLSASGVRQSEIREILRVEMGRVNKVARHLKKKLG